MASAKGVADPAPLLLWSLRAFHYTAPDDSSGVSSGDVFQTVPFHDGTLLFETLLAGSLSAGPPPIDSLVVGDRRQNERWDGLRVFGVWWNGRNNAPKTGSGCYYTNPVGHILVISIY
jgi:hypothetical protein